MVKSLQTNVPTLESSKPDIFLTSKFFIEFQCCSYSMIKIYSYVLIYLKFFLFYPLKFYATECDHE